MDPAWIALIGTLFGGSAFKIIEHLLGRSKVKDDAGASMRTELRGDNGALRAEITEKNNEIDEKNDEIDEWRSKYYQLVSAISSGDINKAHQVIDSHRK